MNTFYKVSLFIFLVVVIICISLITNLISNTKDNRIYSPYIDECPDYYIKQKDSIATCIDRKKISNRGADCRKVDFSTDLYTNPGMGTDSGLCKKKQWAYQCGVNWDGITTNDDICYVDN